MDFESIRCEFPIIEDWVFLDNAGAVPLPRFVTGAMQNFIDEYYRHGITDHWPLLQETVTDCRASFARLIGAEQEEVALVSSTSEGLNIVANMLDFRPGDNIVVTDIEFPSNLFPWLNLEKKGIEVRVVPVLRAAAPLDALAELIDDRTRLVAVAHVSFVNGLKLDLAALAELAHGHGAYLAVDAVQSAGVVPIDVRADGVDFLACSGFKWLMSPSGTGAFFCRGDIMEQYEPAYISWFSVEEPFNFVPGNAMRLAQDARRFMISGNINLIGFQGFRAAIHYILDTGVGHINAHVQSLCCFILQKAHDLGLPVISPLDPSCSGPIVNFQVPEPERLVSLLREQHVYAVQRVGGLRLSPFIYNSVEDIERVMAIVEDYVESTG
jgi:cysteine desulfurase/selenocysteine lyase